MSDKKSEGKRRGRPASARLASRKLSFRVDAAVAESAARRAARERTTLSAVLRELLLGYVSRQSAPVAYVRQLDALRREMWAIGRNLNQITRAINAGIAPASFHEVTDRLTGVISRVVKQLPELSAGQAKRRRA